MKCPKFFKPIYLFFFFATSVYSQDYASNVEINLNNNVEFKSPEIAITNKSLFSSTAEYIVKAKVNTVVEEVFSIENLGTATLNIGDPAVELMKPIGFEIDQPSKIAIAPNQKISFTIRYRAAEKGLVEQTIKVFNDDEDESVYVLQLKIIVE